MALIELGPFTAEITGSIAGTTFGRSLAGAGCRRRAGPGNASTAAQLAARNTQNFVAKQWALLSKTEQALWTAAAQIHPLPTRLGRYRPVSGFALWCQLGTNLVNAGQVLNSTPPSDWTTPPVLAPNVAATLTPTATTSMFASWNATTAIDSVITLKATGPTPWGKTPQREQLRTLTHLAPVTVPPIAVIDLWSAVYGLPPQATPYQILWEFQPYQRTTGVQGPWIDFTMSVGGPDPTSPPTPGSSAGVAPAIAESLTYRYIGSTGSDEWLALTTADNVTYTVVWTSDDITAAPTLQAGPTPTSLTTLATFATTDAFTFTATPGWTYYVGMSPWSTASKWAVTYAPSQVRTFPLTYLTGPNHRTWLIAEATNFRLVSDVQYQGP